MKTTALLAACAVSAASLSVFAQAGSGEVHVWPVRGGVHMVVGPAGNVTVQVGRDGVLVVDTMTAEAAGGLLQEIRKLSDKPVRFVINTGDDADHVGGNEVVAKSGQTLQGGNTRPAALVGGTGGAPIFAHESVLNRLVKAKSPSAGWPTDTYFVRQKDMFVNGEAVQLLHARNAHTDGDTVVVFRRSDVISAGDVFTPDRYPLVDAARGGTIGGLLDALNVILDIAIPELNEEGGTMIVPGHGRLGDESDVADYRDMVTIVRDRVQDMVKKKMTLEQVKAAKPTRDYDGIYATPAYTGDMFVEVVYRTLAGVPRSGR
jgi:glyoxylase-like metal-dependent hydrolase (beta-lactamase superfamily II)